MDASALARALDNLEKSWGALDWWLNFWTILVVLGVAVELVVLITEYAHDWRDFKRGTIHSPEKPSILIFGLGFLGAALVAIGVAGEFRVHVKSGKIETDMRNTTRHLVAIVEKEVADANNETARLTSENLKLRAFIQPRSLTPEQQREIGNILRHLAGERVRMDSFAIDPEAYQLCEQIAAAFTLAHFDVADMCGVFPINARDIKLNGIYITSWKKDAAAESIRKALSTIAKITPVSVTDVKTSSQPEPYLTVLIATKPLSVLK